MTYREEIAFMEAGMTWPLRLEFESVGYRKARAAGEGAPRTWLTDWAPCDLTMLYLVDPEGHRIQVGSDAVIIPECHANGSPGISFINKGPIPASAQDGELWCAGRCDWTSEPFETHGMFRPCKLRVPYHTYTDAEGRTRQMIDTASMTYDGQPLKISAKILEQFAFLA